jgi:5-methylcytosine-specific restriction protein B
VQLSIITNEQDIHAAQKQLQDRIRAEGGPLRRYRLGNRRGQGEAEVCYVARLDLWHTAERLGNRWANGFGLGDPAAVPMLTVVTWINPSFDGSRRSGAGVFFRDADGHAWLAHSGRIGGGKKGIGRIAFLDGFSSAVETIEGHDYVVIGRIAAAEFLDELAAFVRAVQTFKAGVGREETNGDGEDEEGEGEGDESGDLADDLDEAWTIDAVVPTGDAAARRMVLEWIATMIRHAHAQSPACWAVTGRSGPRLRLLVGNTVAFELGHGRVGVGLHPADVPADAVSDGKKPDFLYSRLDGALTRWFSLKSFMRHHEGLRPSAVRFIDLAAGAFRRSPYARFHASEFLDAIARELATTLPRPSYVEGAPSFWKVAPGEKASLWPRCRDGGYIAIGWDELGDLNGLDREGFDARVDEALVRYPHWKRRGVEQAWRFLNIPPGARIVANDGTRRVVGIGTVTGPYHYVDEGTGFAHRLPVQWDDVRERVVEQPGWLRTIIRLSPAGFAAIMQAPSPGEDRPEPPPSEAEPEEKIDFGGITDRLDDTGLRFPDELVASYLLALQAKRFVILSGISGTGKTQLALAIAKTFQPLDVTVDVASAQEADPTEGHRLRVQPYMLKFRRLVVPAVLAESVTGDATSGRVSVRFGDGQSESLRWSAASTATQLLFKGKFREWFEQTFEPGDELDLRVEGDDPPALSIVPVTAAPNVVVPRSATYAVIAVRPDWTDNRGLLGYHNPITGAYQTTPFLRLLLAAAEEEARAAREGRPRLPFFVVLDEMNLARVEHYFSDFLSCLESGEPLHLHDDRLVAEGASETGEAVPMQFSIPRNLFFTGTVNVDETTYMFSPKVLDRAFVLEFNDVDLGGLGAATGDDSSGEASVFQLKRFAGALDIRDKPSPADYTAFRELAGGALHRALVSLNERLQVEHRHFGYRVANEIARFVGLAATQAGREPEILWEALDMAVVSKVLPKLHGTQQELEDVLARLLAFTVDVDSPVNDREHESRWSYSRGRLGYQGEGLPRTPRLPRAAAKLWRMLRRVRQQGYVSFIE